MKLTCNMTFDIELDEQDFAEWGHDIIYDCIYPHGEDDIKDMWRTDRGYCINQIENALWDQLSEIVGEQRPKYNLYNYVDNWCDLLDTVKDKIVKRFAEAMENETSE